MLSSLEIKNFRTFSHLVIERLGRVNLIVGKNNVGKTTLLEALRIYASLWPPSTIGSILHERNELASLPDGKVVLLLHSLFHGSNPSENDEIGIRQFAADGSGNESGVTVDFEAVLLDEGESTESSFYGTGFTFELDIKQGEREFTLSPDRATSYTIPSGSPAPPEFAPDPPCLRGVGSQPHFENTIAGWWDTFALTAAENRVLDALQILAPIEGVSFVADPQTAAGRVAKVRIHGTSDPVPLATLGDGAVRMFQIAVAMEYAAIHGKSVLAADPSLENAFPLLLIDEVESGIHHTLHADLWRFIFKTAELLNVQVFATSHSLDCLKGFAEAASEDEENGGLAIRLEQVEGKERTGAVIIDPEDLPIIVRESIEVR